jgi:hypothetical protein
MESGDAVMTDKRLVYRKVGPIEAWMSKADDGIEVTVYDATIGQWTRTLTPSFSKAYAMVMDAAHVGVRYLAEKYRGR